MTTTPNMLLVLPLDKGSIDQWDAILDAIFSLVDSHDHTTGKGVKVPTAGLNVNADLSWANAGTSYAISDLKAIDFAPVAPATVAALADAFFVSNVDNELYYRNHTGTNIKFTTGATINISIVGGIGGDYSAVAALESFDDATKRYLFQSQGAPRPWSGIASADFDLYEKLASIVNKVTQKSPAGLAASYAVTWLTALPAANSLMMIDATGAMTAPASVTLPNNANITLSGTGMVKTGQRTVTIPVLFGMIVTSAAITSTGGSSPGVIVPAAGTVYIPLPGLRKLERLVSAAISSVASASGTTYSIVSNVDANTAAFTVDYPGTPVTTAANGATCTPTSPIVGSDGITLWMKVAVGGGGARTLMEITLTFDVP